MAFENAAASGFRDAAAKAEPALLEPIMSLQVTVPDEYFGAVTADLNTRRAQITGTELQGQVRIIEAQVPLAEMFGYATALRSLSQGRANPTNFEHSGYQLVPAEVSQRILQTGS